MQKIKLMVLTWDTNAQAFTPQKGVRRGPYTLWGLRKAIRKLRLDGYTARKGDPMVLVCEFEKGVASKKA